MSEIMEKSYSFKEMVQHVLQVIRVGRTPFIWGMPGIGKSALAKEVTRLLALEMKTDIGFYTLDAPLLQPFDYTVAVPNHETKTVELYKTGYLPHHGPAVVCVEDAPHAKIYQTIPLMQIVLDHRIGPLHFDPNVWFIITGNREEDLASTNPLPSPLNNRMLHFTMNADEEEWRMWAKVNGLDNRVAAFIHAFPQHFCKMPTEGVKTWPTPRSWHMLSDVIKNVKDESILRSMASAAVGSAVSSQFITWIKYLMDLDTEAIVTKGIMPVHKDNAERFAIITAVASRVIAMKNEEIKKRAGNIMKFWRQLTGDFKVSFLKELITFNKDGKQDTRVLVQLTILPECSDLVKYAGDLTGIK